MYITLKHDAECRDCGARLAAGTRARWFRDGSVYGDACHRWRVAADLTGPQRRKLEAAAQAVVRAARGVTEIPARTAARLAAIKDKCGLAISRATYQRLIADLEAAEKELTRCKRKK